MAHSSDFFIPPILQVGREVGLKIQMLQDRGLLRGLIYYICVTMINVDVLVDLQFGDCGKGKISKILNEMNNYSSICKYNGGGNSGHAVWLNGKKHTAHYLTSGIYDKETKIVIGPGCVLNPEKFLAEVKSFSDFEIDHRIWIYPQVHLTLDKHIEEDSKDSIIGTTKTGNGPTYADKYSRTGIRMDQLDELDPLREYIAPKSWPTESILGDNVLMEGSQGWFLDIDHGFYPYVTSSHIHPAFAFASFGLPMKSLGNIYGVAKIYETYVGENHSIVDADEEDAKLIRELGGEYGETTGRPRDVGYLHMPRLIDAVNKTGTNILFINKCDILEELNKPTLIDLKSERKTFPNMDEMKFWIKSILNMSCPGLQLVIFSATKEGEDILEQFPKGLVQETKFRNFN